MSRRTDIADAAIGTLAEHGMRGLTHRAVDRAAGLPEGSTSYYFRTRQALLRAVLERLLELDTAEMSDVRAESLQDFVDSGARLLHRMVTAGRDRQLARYELTLEATRRPELRAVLLSAGRLIRGLLAQLLTAAGVPEPDRRAFDLAAFIDGFVFDQVAGAGGREVSVDQVRASLGALVAAVASPRG